MQVRQITSSEVVLYDSLVSQCGSVFYSSDWAGLHGDNLLRYGIFDESNRLKGGFHLFRQRKWGLTILRNPPFTPISGPYFKSEAKNPVAVLEERRKLLDAMAEFLKRLPFSLLFISLDRQIEDGLPFFWRGFKVIPNYTYIVDLSPSIEEIRKSMSQTRRNDISKAIRDGLRVQMTTDRQVVFDLVKNTFDRQDKGLDKHTLHKILNNYATEDNSYTYVTYQGETPLACCLVVLDGRTAYYLLGGYNSNEKHHGAGALAIYEAITHAKALGLDRFDFEGSVIPPIERFFRGFGGRLTPYLTVNKGRLPVELFLKFVRRELF